MTSSRSTLADHATANNQNFGRFRRIVLTWNSASKNHYSDQKSDHYNRRYPNKRLDRFWSAFKHCKKATTSNRKKLQILEAQHCTFSSCAYVLCRKSWEKTSLITNPGVKTSACKSCIWNFGYSISILNYSFWILNFSFWIFNFDFWSLNFEFWFSYFEFWIAVFGFSILRLEQETIPNFFQRIFFRIRIRIRMRIPLWNSIIKNWKKILEKKFWQQNFEKKNFGNTILRKKCWKQNFEKKILRKNVEKKIKQKFWK